MSVFPDFLKINKLLMQVIAISKISKDMAMILIWRLPYVTLCQEFSGITEKTNFKDEKDVSIFN